MRLQKGDWTAENLSLQCSIHSGGRNTGDMYQTLFSQLSTLCSFHQMWPRDWVLASETGRKMMHTICRFSVHLSSPQLTMLTFFPSSSWMWRSISSWKMTEPYRRRNLGPCPRGQSLEPAEAGQGHTQDETDYVKSPRFWDCCYSSQPLCLCLGMVSTVEGKHCGGYAKWSIGVQGENIIASA